MWSGRPICLLNLISSSDPTYFITRFKITAKFQTQSSARLSRHRAVGIEKLTVFYPIFGSAQFRMDSHDSKAVIEPAMTPSRESNNESQVLESGELVNASGHVQELDRNFSLLNICAVGITTGNTWVAIGGSVVSLPPNYEQMKYPLTLL